MILIRLIKKLYRWIKSKLTKPKEKEWTPKPPIHPNCRCSITAADVIATVLSAYGLETDNNKEGFDI